MSLLGCGLYSTVYIYKMRCFRYNPPRLFLSLQIVIVVDQWVGPDDKDSERHILQVISFHSNTV